MRGLLRRFIRPQNLTLEQWGEMLRVGGVGAQSSSGVTVTEGTSMRIATVWRCQRLLSETVSRLFHGTFQKTGLRTSVEIPDHPVGKLLQRPNPEQTPLQFGEFGMMRLLNRGNAYYRIRWLRNGRPGELWPIPGDVEPERPDPKGPLIYNVNSPEKPEGGSSVSERIAAEDILHIPALAFNGLVGMNPIEKARDVFGLAQATEQHGARTFANGARPAGVITYPGIMKDKFKQAFKEEWRDAHGGVEKTGEVAVLEKGMTYASIGMTNEDSQFLESRQFGGEEVCRFYGVPPHMAGFRESQPRANMEQLAREFVDFSLQPWLSRFSQSMMLQLFLQRDFDASIFLRYDVSHLLRADFKTLMEGIGVARNWGIMNADEGRAEINMNPIEGGAGEKYIRPGNMIPLESDETQMTNNPGSQRGVKQSISSREAAMIRDVARRVIRRAAGALQKLEKGTMSLEEYGKQHDNLIRFAAEAFHVEGAMTKRIMESYKTVTRVAVEQSKVGELRKAFEKDDGAELAREVLNETQA